MSQHTEDVQEEMMAKFGLDSLEGAMSYNEFAVWCTCTEEHPEAGE
jgi:hypothetical protein